MKRKDNFSKNLSLTGWLMVCLSVLQIIESLVVMFVNLLSQIQSGVGDSQKTILSNIEKGLSESGTSFVDVLNQFEIIHLVILILMSFFVISLFQNLKSYLNQIHKIFDLDLFLIIFVFSNIFLIMISLIMFLVGKGGVIEEVVGTISLVLSLVYLVFSIGFFIRINLLSFDFLGLKKQIFYLGMSYTILNIFRVFIPYSLSNIFTIVHFLFFLVSFSYWICWSMFFFKSSKSLIESK